MIGLSMAFAIIDYLCAVGCQQRQERQGDKIGSRGRTVARLIAAVCPVHGFPGMFLKRSGVAVQQAAQFW